jgi:hypothetical protein
LQVADEQHVALQRSSRDHRLEVRPRGSLACDHEQHVRDLPAQPGHHLDQEVEVLLVRHATLHDQHSAVGSTSIGRSTP